jgi:hypothetical protein
MRAVDLSDVANHVKILGKLGTLYWSAPSCRGRGGTMVRMVVVCRGVTFQSHCRYMLRAGQSEIALHQTLVVSRLSGFPQHAQHHDTGTTLTTQHVGRKRSGQLEIYMAFSGIGDSCDVLQDQQVKSPHSKSKEDGDDPAGIKRGCTWTRLFLAVLRGTGDLSISQPINGLVSNHLI